MSAFPLIEAVLNQIVWRLRVRAKPARPIFEHYVRPAVWHARLYTPPCKANCGEGPPDAQSHASEWRMSCRNAGIYYPYRRICASTSGPYEPFSCVALDLSCMRHICKFCIWSTGDTALTRRGAKRMHQRQSSQPNASTPKGSP